MPSIKTAVPRGMLYVYDYDGKNIDIPGYDSSEIVSSTENAISIAVLGDQDGDVEIEILTTRDGVHSELKEIFSGEIACQSGQLSVCFMADEQIFSVPAQIGKAKVRIFSSDESFPEKLLIVVDS